MIREPRWNRRGGGFTLIELITVMGIIGILVALIVGAVASVRETAFKDSTLSLFGGLDSALGNYYRDFSAYPWHDASSPYPMMGVVPSTAEFNPLKAVNDPAFQVNGANAMLVATLSVPMRKATSGYFQPSAGQVMERKTAQGGGRTYRLFQDGWGRPISYYPPQMAADSGKVSRTSPNGSVAYDPGLTKIKDSLSTFNGFYQGRPVLESKGKEEFDDADNLVNYGIIKLN